MDPSAGGTGGGGVQQAAPARLVEAGQGLATLGGQAPAELAAQLAAAFGQALADWRPGATRARLEEELHPALRRQAQTLGHGLERVGMVLIEAGGGYDALRQATLRRLAGAPGADPGSLDDSDRYAGEASQRVRADPNNPAPYDRTDRLPPGLVDLTKQVAGSQLDDVGDKRNGTVAGAMVTKRALPAEASTPVRTIPNSEHAEVGAMEESVALLRGYGGRADVDLVTENRPCAESCTPMLVSGRWYQQLRDSAGKGAKIDFRVWTHRATPEGDLSLYCYWLPPATPGGNPRLYISKEMWAKMRGTPVPAGIDVLDLAGLEQALRTL